MARAGGAHPLTGGLITSDTREPRSAPASAASASPPGTIETMPPETRRLNNAGDAPRAGGALRKMMGPRATATRRPCCEPVLARPFDVRAVRDRTHASARCPRLSEPRGSGVSWSSSHFHVARACAAIETTYLVVAETKWPIRTECVCVRTVAVLITKF